MENTNYTFTKDNVPWIDGSDVTETNYNPAQIGRKNTDFGYAYYGRLSAGL
jgi:hypothetical protein